MAGENDRECSATVTYGLDKALQRNQRFCMKVMCIANEQRDGFLPLPDQVAECPFTLLRLCRDLEVFFGTQIVEQCVYQDRQTDLALLDGQRFGDEDFLFACEHHRPGAVPVCFEALGVLQRRRS